MKPDQRRLRTKPKTRCPSTSGRNKVPDSSLPFLPKKTRKETRRQKKNHDIVKTRRESSALESHNGTADEETAQSRRGFISRTERITNLKQGMQVPHTGSVRGDDTGSERNWEILYKNQRGETPGRDRTELVFDYRKRLNTSSKSGCAENWDS